MTSVSAAGEARHGRVAGARLALREHGYLLSGIVWVLIVLNLNSLAFPEPDEFVQFGITKHLFHDGPESSGYFFGLALLYAPFYAFGGLLSLLGLGIHGPNGGVEPNDGHQFSIALGVGLLSALVWPFLHPVVRGLRIPRPGLSLLLAALGTPFLFYATVQPAKTHTVEAVLFTLLLMLLWRFLTTENPSFWLELGMGVTIGYATTVRYTNCAQAPALALCLLLLHRYRAAFTVAFSSGILALAIMSWPIAHHQRIGVTEYRGRQYVDHTQGSIEFNFKTPFEMLFDTHRGLFFWSPIALVGVVGLVFLWRRRSGIERRFLETATVTGFAILGPYLLAPWGTTGWSFSNRFLTPLLPLYALGLAGFIAYFPWRRIAIAATGLALAWSTLLFMNALVFGGRLIRIWTVWDMARLPITSHASWRLYAWAIEQHSNIALWRFF